MDYDKLDIDRLHDVISGKRSGRGSGRTFAMCVQAIQKHTGDTEEAVYIYAGSVRRLEPLMYTFKRAAYMLGYTSIRNRGNRNISIRTTVFKFRGRPDDVALRGGPPCEQYYDHDCINASVNYRDYR